VLGITTFVVLDCWPLRCTLAVKIFMQQAYKSIQEIKANLWYFRVLKFIKNLPFKFTVILRLVWLLFPSVFFVGATYFCFWDLPQGKDVLIAALETKWTRGLILLAIIFFSLVTWYSSRVLVYQRPQLFKDSHILSFHFPRVLGFSVYSILILAMLKIPPLPEQHFSFRISLTTANILFALSILVYYPILYILIKKYRDKNLVKKRKNQVKSAAEEKAQKLKFRFLYTLLGCVLGLMLSANFFLYGNLYGWFFWLSLIVVQFIYLTVVIVRRGRLPENNKDPQMPLTYKNFKAWQAYQQTEGKQIPNNLWRKVLYYSNISNKELWFFRLYNFISAASLLIYLFVINKYSFAVTLGALGTLMLAFGILSGIFSVVSYCSVIYRVNFHVLLLIIAFLMGGIFEPHKVNIISSTSTDYRGNKNQRPLLKEYFINWLANHKTELDSAKTELPLLFVLADGGASRSGYWTATVLGTLEDSTNGNFSNHLFCLSGASGGSVGNGTFMALLKDKKELKTHFDHGFKNGAASFLKNDFLSFTLARMLGPDIIRPMFAFIPINTMGDRAEALENAMELAGDNERTFLHSRFKAGFGTLIANRPETNTLPIFCINCTRMQDGKPSVVSTIKLQSQIFGKRLDVLDELDSAEDLKISTAVALGARFPYISPAGRIKNSYYVDGGYFDNSGSGFVLETITELRKLQNDPDVKKISSNIGKLSFYIIHIQNGEAGDITPTKIHPLMNDLAAPVSTLVGAYGTQTSVNDWRLEKYMAEIDSVKNRTHYFKVNLHSEKDTADSYPMNWAISQYYINRMDAQLKNRQMKILLDTLKSKIK
jgi:predicted acylesterase/phospholipase RssA